MEKSIKLDYTCKSKYCIKCFLAEKLREKKYSLVQILYTTRRSNK